jgi:hypothetical protein
MSTSDETSSSVPNGGVMRTYTLQNLNFLTPDGREMRTGRALAVSVGTQALEPGSSLGKTLIRFELWKSGLLAENPQMRMQVGFWDESKPPVNIEGANAVELVFDNNSFLAEQKEMPFWLIDALEFAAKKLREQYALNQDGELRFEQLD